MESSATPVRCIPNSKSQSRCCIVACTICGDPLMYPASCSCNYSQCIQKSNYFDLQYLSLRVQRPFHFSNVS
jgi:hypothetical protein